MSKDLPALTPKKVIKILEKLGFRFYRQTGSHRIYIKDEKQVVVPFHSRDLKKGTLYQIIKGSGVTAEDFIKML